MTTGLAAGLPSPNPMPPIADGVRLPWDAVVDVCGYVPRVVGASVAALAKSAGTYLMISTINAYPEWPGKAVDESSLRHECEPDAGPEDGDYGKLKVGCERAVTEGFPGRTLVIEPGLMAKTNGWEFKPGQAGWGDYAAMVKVQGVIGADEARGDREDERLVQPAAERGRNQLREERAAGHRRVIDRREPT